MRTRALTDLLLRYQSSGQGKEELIKQTGLYMYQMARRKNDWDEDDVSEFFCHFYPKIPELIDRFIYCGKPFEAYLITYLKWSMRNFAVKLKKQHWRQQVYSREELWELHDHDPAYLAESPSAPRWLRTVPEEGGSNISAVWRLRLLFLCMRECEQLDGSMIERISAVLQVDRDWLLCTVERLRGELEAVRLRLERSTAARNECFVRLQLLEKECSRCGDEQRRSLLLGKIRRERQQLELHNKRVSRYRLRPTNKDIARIMGVPKGSVDSGLYYLFHRLPPLMDREGDAA